MKTKQIVSLVLAALLSFAMLALSVGAKGSTASVIVFDDKMDVSAWSYWGRNVTSYDAGTNSFKVTANEWSMYATCMEMDSGDGTNFSTLTDIGVTPVNIRCEGGYNYLKIKMKTPEDLLLLRCLLISGRQLIRRRSALGCRRGEALRPFGF